MDEANCENVMGCESALMSAGDPPFAAAHRAIALPIVRESIGGPTSP
jgi:hypothetical protein